MLRPTRRSLAVFAVAALALAGCGSSSSDSSSSDVLSKVTVTDADTEGAAPTVTLEDSPLKASETESKVITEGDGAEVAAGDLLVVNAVVVNGRDGAVINENYSTGPIGIDLQDTMTFPALVSALPGVKVGSRVLVAAPPKDAFGTEGATAIDVQPEDTVIFLFDITAATKALAEAEGTAVDPVAGLPTVQWTATAPATITMPEGTEAPTALVVQDLITGTGAKTANGQTIRVSYTGAVWGTGQIFDSSIGKTPAYFKFVHGAGGVVPGWDKGLLDKPVGSRLLLVLPPAEGYGSAGNASGGIAGTDTLVFVVDILAAY